MKTDRKLQTDREWQRRRYWSDDAFRERRLAAWRDWYESKTSDQAVAHVLTSDCEIRLSGKVSQSRVQKEPIIVTAGQDYAFRRARRAERLRRTKALVRKEAALAAMWAEV